VWGIKRLGRITGPSGRKVFFYWSEIGQRREQKWIMPDPGALWASNRGKHIQKDEMAFLIRCDPYLSVSIEMMRGWVYQ
jgi:hypothetical protein